MELYKLSKHPYRDGNNRSRAGTAGRFYLRPAVTMKRLFTKLSATLMFSSAFSSNGFGTTVRLPFARHIVPSGKANMMKYVKELLAKIER
ncbi:hypothetical protein [Pelotomaculum propionicicum]|uniref:hypothetical protein n=1 Tax=Pelotomaculum propionicicum TaxID=258475 RepID=UPI001065EE57|nr:hypothetical protein [Pelotomaculum propionicicum]NLI13303.1 hypothetical protein [Peptococcaceae bacterium]